jgi:ABC-type lipoprotein release transport system permease subunit
VGRLLLVGRLAMRDLRRRRAEAALLLLAIAAATSTLTLGLVLRDTTIKPYEKTQEATAGPDVVANVAPAPVGDRGADLAALTALAEAPGVVDHSGPYPVVEALMEANGRRVVVQAQGRQTAAASVDQPKSTRGSWVRDGGVVVEAAFAEALGVDPGDRVTLRPISIVPRNGEPMVQPRGAGRRFQIAGVAVSAASAPYPEISCLAHCIPGAGLVWLTEADALSVEPREESLLYVLNLALADPAAARAFAEERNPRPGSAPEGPSDPSPPLLRPWQDIRDQTASLVDNQRRALLTGAWLLALLAVASIGVLVGGRMADQVRRVGLLKAVGGTPGLVAAVLLAEYVVVALVAAGAGLTVGWVTAPLLTASSGLLGSTGAVTVTVSTVGLVTAVALAVAVAATLVPAIRAARTSTVLALADAARPPRRTGWLIALSRRLPVPLLLGLRVAGRRPRRTVLAMVSIGITVSGIVAALAAHADLDASDARADRLNQVLLVITITLVALAAVNAIFVTFATALDVRRSSALTRALGATPQQVSAGLSAAQVLPALAGAVLGIPGGIALIAAVDPDATTTLPPLWQLLAVVPGTVLLIAGLTVIPARIGARRPVAEILQSELA